MTEEMGNPVFLTPQLSATQTVTTAVNHHRVFVATGSMTKWWLLR